MIPEPFLTVYPIHRHQKPFKTVTFLIEVPNHRAKATLLTRSLRVTMLFKFRAPALPDKSNRPTSVRIRSLPGAAKM
jgi:hypothetical protein